MKSIFIIIATLLYFSNSAAAGLQFSCSGVSNKEEFLSLSPFDGEIYPSGTYSFVVNENEIILAEEESLFDSERNVKISKGYTMGTFFAGGGSQSYTLNINYSSKSVALEIKTSATYNHSTENYYMNCAFASNM